MGRYVKLVLSLQKLIFDYREVYEL